MENIDISTKENLKEFLRKNRKKKVLILSGEKSFFASGANKIFNNTKTILKKNIYPEIKELKDLFKKVHKFKPDILIAIGGGSVLDYAKIINILRISDLNNMRHKIKNNLFLKNLKNYYLVAVPTTAGTGAEITSNAVIYIQKKKFSFEGQNLIPDLFLLCPDLLTNCPISLRASAGFDAISQAVESILSLKSNKTSLIFAKRSLELSIQNYLKFVKKKNFNNTTKMILSAHYSGKAISISKTIAPHAVSYPFTSYYGISHGHAVSLNLEKFLLFNYKNIIHSDKNFNLNSRYKILFNLFKVNNINELCKKINFFKSNANLEDDFTKLGININKDIERILNGVNVLRLKNNPISIDKKDLKRIILN